jgi:hypothetical protein
MILKQRNHLRDLGVDGSVILKWIIREVIALSSGMCDFVVWKQAACCWLLGLAYSRPDLRLLLSQGFCGLFG